MRWFSLFSPEEKEKHCGFGGGDREILSCIHCDCKAQAYHCSDNSKGETGQDIRPSRL